MSNISPTGTIFVHILRFVVVGDTALAKELTLS